MNSGAEAVETALKVSRRWGYQVKGVPEDQAVVIVMGGNFHGRTTTIVSFSDDPDASTAYGPFTPGFRLVPYGDAAALRAAVEEGAGRTVAVLLEPIQGEGGVVIPPEGFLRDVRAICSENDVLMVADEIQSGLGRTGRTFACDHEGVCPTSTCSARRWAVASTRSRRSRPTTTCSRHHARVPRLDVRRQPAGRRDRSRGRADADDR